MTEAVSFLVTTEHRRFVEFCDACRQYRYIGLCYGAPGVGKTLSARRYVTWDVFEAIAAPWRADDAALAAFDGADTVLYTPEIVNSPRGVARDVIRLCTTLRTIREEPARRAHSDALQARTREQVQRQVDLLLTVDYLATPVEKPEPGVPPDRTKYDSQLAPVRLVLVDEADRLRVPSLEQLRDLFDRNDIGLILIGMPGIEKRLARYPQLYSRVGFVHAFRMLRAEEIRRLLANHWRELGLAFPSNGIANAEAVAAIIRITGGNFRLLHRLLSQVERVLRINGLNTATPEVVEAARDSLVIGTA
jgi:DNA transposition AAA+ family ATPase